jgi:hypothetical protein
MASGHWLCHTAKGGMQSVETMPSWPRLWGFVGRRGSPSNRQLEAVPGRAADLAVNSHNRRMAWELARCPAGMSSAAAAFVCFLDPAESDLVRW